jgi:outer membrane receptor protein involved in Fe transport
VVVTGTRLSPIDERTPAQVEQINLSRTIASPAALPSTLQTLPGISMFDDFGAWLQPELQVRGFVVSPIVGIPQGVSVFLDGVRMNEPDAQEVNFDLIPMEAVRNATLVRGSNVLFGRNSLGGSILLETRRGGDVPEATVELGGGSFGQRLATITAGGKVHGIDGYIAATGLNESGWRTATSSNTRNVFATIGYQWGPTHDSGDVALDLLYGHDRIYEAGSLPVSYLQVDPRINYTPGDFFHPEAFGATLRGTQSAGGGIVRGTLWGRRNNYEQYNVNVPPPNTDENIDNLSGGVTAEWTRPIVWHRTPIGLTVGGEVERDNVHFHLVNTASGSPDSTATLSDVRQANAALYAQAVVGVTPHLDATAGLRADYIRIPYHDDLNPANDGTSTYDRLSPEIGLTYRFTDDVRGYVAYKSGFRAPAPLELACATPSAPCALPSALGADPVLKPVSSHDYEGGLDVDVTRRTSVDIDAFWTDVDDDIVLASPSLTAVYFVNVPKTRRAGVEASTVVGLPEGMRLRGSYSYVAATDPTWRSGSCFETSPRPAEPGDIFPSSPLHRGSVGLGIGRLLGPVLLDGEFDLNAFSSAYLRGDESNQRRPVSGYTVAALRGHANYGRYGVELDVENLFNRQYYTFGIEAANTLGPLGSSTPPTYAPIVPFYTPSFPRRVTLTLSARL